MDHTAFNLQITPCLPLPRKRSPDGASTECGGELDKVTAVPFFSGHGVVMGTSCKKIVKLNYFFNLKV